MSYDENGYFIEAKEKPDWYYCEGCDTAYKVEKLRDGECCPQCNNDIPLKWGFYENKTIERENENPNKI